MNGLFEFKRENRKAYFLYTINQFQDRHIWNVQQKRLLNWILMLFRGPSISSVKFMFYQTSFLQNFLRISCLRELSTRAILYRKVFLMKIIRFFCLEGLLKQEQRKWLRRVPYSPQNKIFCCCCFLLSPFKLTID